MGKSDRFKKGKARGSNLSAKNKERSGEPVKRSKNGSDKHVAIITNKKTNCNVSRRSLIGNGVRFCIKKIFFIRKNEIENSGENGGFNIYNHKVKILLISVFLLVFSSFTFKVEKVAGKTKLVCKVFNFNKGIDFAGGISVEARCEKCNNNVIDEVKKKVEKQTKSSVSCQKINDNFLFKTVAPDDYDKTYTTFKDIILSSGLTIVGADYVSPQMTSTFISDSIFACVFAFACICIYMIVRFNCRFAFASILSLIYDVLMVLAFISRMQIEVCLITLTALLTIIGYCINDKIVVLDRIRENLFDTARTVPNIIRDGVKSVLLRSTLTSLTTMIVATSLLFFGDRLIYELGITIICGIFIGTLSSLLLMPSLLLVFRAKHKRSSSRKNPMFYAS